MITPLYLLLIFALIFICIVSIIAVVKSRNNSMWGKFIIFDAVITIISSIATTIYIASLPL